MRKKKLLFIIRHAPYGNLLARESLDAVLAASVYEQGLSVLFLDDGVFQLAAHQKPADGQKNISKLLSAFPLYDINEVFACRSSLKQRNLDTTALCIDVEVLNSNEVQRLLQQQDQLISF